MCGACFQFCDTVDRWEDGDRQKYSDSGKIRGDWELGGNGLMGKEGRQNMEGFREVNLCWMSLKY